MNKEVEKRTGSNTKLWYNLESSWKAKMAQQKKWTAKFTTRHSEFGLLQSVET